MNNTNISEKTHAACLHEQQPWVSDVSVNMAARVLRITHFSEIVVKHTVELMDEMTCSSFTVLLQLLELDGDELTWRV